MTNILLLLTMALQLLVSANQPNVPVSLRNTAISVANTAIEVANKAIKDAGKPVLGAIASPTLSISPKPSPSASPVAIASPSPSFSPLATPEPIIIYKETIRYMTPTPLPSELILSSKLVYTAEQVKSPSIGNDYAPYGSYSIKVVLIGEGGDKQFMKRSDGSFAVEYLIKMDAPDQSPVIENPQIRPIGLQGNPVKEYVVQFSYDPQTPGKKTLTFTSGSLTKTIDIDVK